jgi:soluble lytic murein transglycosylase-like protein
MKRILATVLLISMLLVGNAQAFVIPPLAYELRERIQRETWFVFGSKTYSSLISAQIHQESLWNPKAKSYVGAAGLAQFMPTTATWISRLYPKDLRGNNPYDIEWAIRAMVRYDKLLYDKYEWTVGEHRLAFMLSAYNGGAGNVEKDRTLATEKGRDPTLWFCNTEHWSNRKPEFIKENRNYAKYIISNLWKVYRAAGF